MQTRGTSTKVRPAMTGSGFWARPGVDMILSVRHENSIVRHLYLVRGVEFGFRAGFRKRSDRLSRAPWDGKT